MTHLTTDERLALIESAGAPNHPHLATCARCRAEVEEGRIALGDVRLSEVVGPHLDVVERGEVRRKERPDRSAADHTYGYHSFRSGTGKAGTCAL